MQNKPKLRFKEFNDEWREDKLGNLFLINAGGDIDSSHCSSEKTDKFRYPIYANALTNNGLYGYSDIYKVEGHTVTVTGRGDIGHATPRKEPYYPIVRLLILRPQYNENVDFFASVINSTRIFLESTGVPQLTSPQLSKVKVSYPSTQEQNRIAEVLNKVDEVIVEREAEVKDLEQKKKGLMQKLFSQQLRFTDSDNNPYPEWEEDLIGNLFGIKAGGDIDTKRCSKTKTEIYKYPVYANALTSSGLYGYTDDYKVSGNTITVTGRGDVGHATPRHEQYYPIVRLLVLTPKYNANVDFFASLINSTKIFIESTGVPQLTSPQLAKVKVKYPCLEEQEKIAMLNAQAQLMKQRVGQFLGQDATAQASQINDIASSQQVPTETVEEAPEEQTNDNQAQ